MDPMNNSSMDLGHYKSAQEVLTMHHYLHTLSCVKSTEHGYWLSILGQPFPMNFIAPPPNVSNHVIQVLLQQLQALLQKYYKPIYIILIFSPLAKYGELEELKLKEINFLII